MHRSCISRRRMQQIEISDPRDEDPRSREGAETDESWFLSIDACHATMDGKLWYQRMMCTR